MLAAACTTIEAPLKSHLESPTAALRVCANWFEQLDAAIDRAGVRDAAAHRVPGFPYVRVDRFSASFRDRARDNQQAFAAWVGRLQELDSKARGYEIANLPPQFFPLAGIGDRAAASAHTRICAAQLAHADLGHAAQRALLIGRAQVPDSYASWNRRLGLYALTRIPFMQGVERWQQETAAQFGKARQETATASGILRYAPAAGRVSTGQLAGIFLHPNTDALGIPRFTEAQRSLLFQAYAPVFEIETTGAYDRFGPLSWRDGPAPEVDITRPLAYRRLTFTRANNGVLTQLVYTIWFPERPASGAADLLAGRLDGIVFRVTLGSDGAPLVYDSIHPCGCYHMFFPTALVKPLPSPESAIEWAFAPLTLPQLAPAQRVAVRISSRTHSIVDVRADAAAAASAYQFADEDELRALPAAGHATRSAFGPDGIVPATERGERYFFWPMGIDNVGAMRQWGTHATAFIGRRHFDDADLIERRFDLPSGADAKSVQAK